MCRLSTILFIIWLSLPRMATGQITQIIVIDKATGIPIENAHIVQLKKHAISDKTGKALIEIAPGHKIQISHISYRDTSFFPPHNSVKQLIIKLEPSFNILPEVLIDEKPIRIFAPAKTHVFDFEFWNDSLLVMTYEKEKLFRKGNEQCQALYLGCKLLLISKTGSIIDSIPLPDLIHGFYKDPLGQVFVLGANFVTLIQFKMGKLTLSKIEPDEFETYIKPLKGNTSTHYFYDDYEWDYPEFSYYNLDKTTKAKQRIRTIKDAFTMELFRAEFKYLSNPDKLKALRLQARTGIDKEIFGAYMSGFANHPYYHKLYAPMFAFGDGTIIFDHHSNYLFFHNSEGEAIDSTEIYYNSTKLKFKEEIIASEDSNQFYAVYQKSGIKSLREINLQSGKPSSIIDLYYPYPEHIRISGNSVFYIYRKTGSDKTKHLFMEAL